MKTIVKLMCILGLVSLTACTQKLPISRTIHPEIANQIKPIYGNAIALKVSIDEEHKVLTKNPTGFVGGGVPFQSELGNVFSGVTRDAFDVMFNDVFYVDDFTNVNPKDNIDFLVDVDYNINKVEYELSYASNKFDKALFGGTAKVNVANKEKKNVYQKSYDIVGSFENTGVGGDTAAFEIAISRYITTLVSHLNNDVSFKKLFSSRASKYDSDIEVKLDKLKELKDSGTITEEEYTNTRKQLLNNI
ncbi:SHOCT domain-containing protein [Trichlorobacter sp.]|uniref:SHOCT domain-containing protein n=1 Tax=Trichlorobacter sp. TaxID=2911007 RepID=UPI002A35DDEE|nr:SHOCT domain-containing protein [Trichlorobacter sp.]MDY0384050.1 SHOCT domain-containing protein [Trichlorobacter sp.]